jgi:hypothetical protein
LIFLAQTDDAALERKARDAAERLGLTFEKRVTGYGDLPAFLSAQTAAERTRQGFIDRYDGGEPSKRFRRSRPTPR